MRTLQRAQKEKGEENKIRQKVCYKKNIIKFTHESN